MISKALEINLESSRVHVNIHERYTVLQVVMSRYEGIMEGLNSLLTEICHPYRNWPFIVSNTRRYALDYFHLLKGHPGGPEAAKCYADIFLDAAWNGSDWPVRADGADSLLLYIQEILKASGGELPVFLPVLEYAFDQMKGCDDEAFFLFVKSYYEINRIASDLLQSTNQQTYLGAMSALLKRYLHATYTYWLKVEDPEAWFCSETGLNPGQESEIRPIFSPVSHGQLSEYLEQVHSISGNEALGPEAALKHLVPLPGYNQIVKIYRGIPEKLLKAGKASNQGDKWKLIFLFHMMNTAGLSAIHEDSLREINRMVSGFVGREDPRDMEALIQKTFANLKVSAGKYPHTALNCVLNVGKAVYGTDESELVDFFIDAVVSLGFQAPELRGWGDDWQMRSNAAHVRNIRVWLELIEQDPKWSKKLLSSLIIYLSLCGVFIKDTDLFPRDITRFLNSEIGPVFNLAKQLSRLFPAYFNEIGAEGDLREVSTRIDEISQRKDMLIHFLRKQSHVESSNQIVGLMDAILNFWRTKDKTGLQTFVPQNVYREIDPEGPYVYGVHRVISRVFEKKALSRTQDLLEVEESSLREIPGELEGISDADLERVELAVRFYKLLHEKYHLGFIHLDNELARIQSRAFLNVEKLRAALSEKGVPEKLASLLSYLEELKEIILSREPSEIREDIYHKRHVAVDIPSMYGSYHETKFDTLGLIFRLESLVNVLFEALVDQIDLKLITRATFSLIDDCLRLFYRALKLDGMISSEMERQLDLLESSLRVRGFSFTQYVDIFQGFARAVRNIVNDFYNNMHQQNLAKILKQLPADSLVSRYRPAKGTSDQDEVLHRVSEIFLRERITSSLGLPQLDLFLSHIMSTLHQQADRLPEKGLRLLLNWDPHKAVTPIHPVLKDVCDILQLGNKGLNLVRLKEYGFPVPQGFIVTTEVFRCREMIDSYPPAENNLKEQIARELATLEKLSGKSLGHTRNTLLLSVRSGAPISLPGMMDTFLNVGINEDIVEGMIGGSGQTWFAWDCYRRFLQSYGMSFGLDRDGFDDIIAEFKKRLGVPYKRDFTGPQMRQVAMTYKSLIGDSGIRIETSPFEQLCLAVKSVRDSWHSPKARMYRSIMGISDDWGTAVTVQQMVFGNFSQRSGSGVVFTHSPRWSVDAVILWGDFTVGNQGEDVVSGLVKTLPISTTQAESENRHADITLETHFPAIYGTLRDVAKKLVYDRGWGPQEMEFTFESPSGKDLYFLQTRDMAMRESKKFPSFVVTPQEREKLIGHGIGVSGGAMSGRVVYSLEEIRRWREEEPHSSLILVRGDTVPDDIHEISEADGLLTGLGGSTSHAAIVAHRLGKTCVVGCAGLMWSQKENLSTLDHVQFKSGDWISIDGQEGAIYIGKIQTEEAEKG
jgi:pyruvate,orthophosphate dikinase